ncbi:MAG: metallophosphoesterase [Phycisphaerae bacterium]|nr:metallophosphoesterase [Gemmatimonadaceae bacterium]
MAYFTVYLLVCWSVVGVLTWRLFPGAAAAVIALAAYTAVPLYVFFYRLRWTFYPGALFRVAVVRVLLYTQLTLPFVALAGALGMLLAWPFDASLVFGRALALIVLVGACMLLLAGYFGSRSLVVRDVEARISNLPAEFDGLRIVQLSDLHVGPQSSRSFLERVVRTVETLKPDLIAVTGDLIDDRPEDVTVYAHHLGRLAAPLGVFMIAGNHDVYAGWTDVARELHRLVPGRVLVNESFIIKRGAAELAIVGTGDPAGMQRGAGAQVGPDLPRAFSGVPAGMVTVVLAHNPGLWPAIKKLRAELTLSGHTHWGQFAFPKRNWSLASRFLKHAMGAYHEDGSLLYISPGTGYWGIPFRIGALPEITAVTLRRSPIAGITMGEARGAL